MSIDLSFTNDSAWMKRRELLWIPFGKILRKEFGAQVESDIHHYFMTGELRNGEPDHDGARLSYFPLQSQDGWDYVLQFLVKGSDVYEKKFYDSLRRQDERFETGGQELDFWDYFHPNVYQPIVRSRVPVGKDKTIVEIEVNPYKVGSNIANGMLGYFEFSSYGFWPKWCQRVDYFFSILPYLVYDESVKYRKRDPVFICYTQLKLLFNSVFRNTAWADMDDPERHRERFSEIIKQRFESMDNLPKKMLELWSEAKSGGCK